jgi:hypothetical protein
MTGDLSPAITLATAIAAWYTMNAMSAVKKPTVAGKEASVRIAPQVKTPAKVPATPPTARKSVHVKQPMAHPLAKPVHEKLLPGFEGAKSITFGAKAGAQEQFKKGDKFVFTRWTDEALLDLERIVFGDQDPISLPAWVTADDVEGLTTCIRQARAFHVAFVIPVYLDIARRSLANDLATKPVDPKASIWARPQQAPTPEPITPVDEMRLNAAGCVGNLLYWQQFNEAERCLRAHRRVDDAERTWGALVNADKNLLRALVQLLDNIQDGVVPTKKEIKEKALKPITDPGQASRLLSLSSLLACLPGAKTGPEPAKRRDRR